jgi:hypothetical protein
VIFLMNDAMLDVDMHRLAPPMEAGRFRALQLPFVLQLGRELFSARPLMQREDPERAIRLAALIVCKAPQINAALFSAPAPGCRPEEVVTRLADLDVLLMASLYTRHAASALNPATVDNEVWRRMAA